MILKIIILISVVSFSAFSLACGISRAAQEKRVEVIFDDGKKNDSASQAIVDDRERGSQNPQITGTNQNSSETFSRLGDLSEVITKYDRYGNKIETRYFKNHPRLDFVLIETTPNRGGQIYVYGHGTDVRTLPFEMNNSALTASGDEIANAAGIYETSSDAEIKNFRKPDKPLQPLPSVNFPAVAQPNIGPQPEAEKQNTEPQQEESPSNASGNETEDR